MAEKYKLGRWEIACIMLNVMTYKLFTGFPRLFAEVSGTGGWLTCLLSGAAAVAVIALILLLYGKLGAVSILDAAEIVAGRAGRWIVGIILLAYLIFSNALALREFTEVMKTVAFPAAGVGFVMLFFVAAMVIGTLSGFDAIARMHVLAVPAALIITAVMTLSALKSGDMGNLFPIFGSGADKVFGKGLITTSIYSDVIFLFLINPFAGEKVKWRKTGLLAAVGGVILTSAVILTFMLLVPYPISADTGIPIYPVAKAVYYGRLFQRTDAFYMLALAMQGMLYMSLSLFFTTYVTADILKLPHSRPLTYVFGLIGFLAAMTVQRSAELSGIVCFSAYILWTVGFLLPLLCAFAAYLRGGKKEGIADAEK